MPLYPHIPYLNEGRILRQNEEDNDNMSNEFFKVGKESHKKIETFKTKVNENLKMLNLKMSNMIQESIDGVDNLCSQVKGCIQENENRKTNFRKNKTQHSEMGDCVNANFDEKTDSRTNSDEIFKEDTKNNRRNKTIEEKQNNKKKTPPTKVNIKKLINKTREFQNVEKKSEENPIEKRISVKERIGEIEEGYQRVVDNLNMVEKMMASIKNNQKKNSEEENKGETKLTTNKNEDKVREENNSVLKIQKSEKESTKEDNNKRKVKNRTNKKQRKEQEKQQTIITKEKTTDEKTLNPLSRIQIHDSLSNIDALIENAVQDLGNLIDLDFETSSRKSSTQSQKSCRELIYKGAVYSSRSNSDESTFESEDCEKFELSRSFQELKDSYLRKLKQETKTASERKKNTKTNQGETNEKTTVKKRTKERSADLTKIRKTIPFNDLEEEIFTVTPQSDEEYDQTPKKKRNLKDNEEPFSNIQSEEKTPKKTFNKPQNKKTKKPKRKLTENIVENTEEDFKEIKRVEIPLDEESSSTCTVYSSLSNVENHWKIEENSEISIEKIDPLRELSLRCRKLMDDLVEEENYNRFTTSFEEIALGDFNCELIKTTMERIERSRSFKKIHVPVPDPDLSALTPEVHRKKAISDLHERMEFQIRQTDSLDGFLNLMDREKRKAIIKQAERQDHSVKCQLKMSFRKKYPFKVVTSMLPTTLDNRNKDKKDNERKQEKYINSLWFSPKDFKLRKNSKIFNKKRLELYCQTLNNNNNKVPQSERSKCYNDQNNKPSNYSITVRSGTPIGCRPYTPRRDVRTRPMNVFGHVKRLRHCDILDDLTLKDLAPFNAEYPRRDAFYNDATNLKDSLIYKLAGGGQNGDEVDTLTSLISPKLSRSQVTTGRVLKNKQQKSKRRTRKSDGGESATPLGQHNDMQTLSCRTAAQLLIQNIGEIKRKSSIVDKRRVNNVKKKRNVESDRKKTFLRRCKPKTDDSHRILFPYINDPDNKVFQQVTVLPVSVFYGQEALKEDAQRSARSVKISRVREATIEEADESDEAQVAVARPCTADDPNKKRKTARRRVGTPRAPPRSNDAEIVEGAQDVARASRRSRSLERGSTEGDSGVAKGESHRNGKQQNKKTPWKPTSRRPKEPSTTLGRDGNVAKLFQQQSACARSSFASSQPVEVAPARKNPPLKPSYQRCQAGRPDKQQDQVRSQTSKSTIEERKTTCPRSVKCQRHLPSPNRRITTDYLEQLRRKNCRMDDDIKKSINVIEDKMVDVLSTNDSCRKKKTMDDMEKAINRVLKMIKQTGNDETSTVKPTNVNRSSDVATNCHSDKNEDKNCESSAAKKPKKRSTSKTVKFQNKPIVLDEENERNHLDNQENTKLEEDNEEKEEENNEIKEDNLKSEEEIREPSKKIVQKTEAPKKIMSKEAFGKFAEIVRNKTNLIIDLTEKIDVKVSEMLPSAELLTAFPGIMAQEKLSLYTNLNPLPNLESTIVNASPELAKIDVPAEKMQMAPLDFPKIHEKFLGRSLTTFRDPKSSNLWQNIRRTYSIDLRPATCPVRRRMKNDNFPNFARVLNEENPFSSRSFSHLVDFLGRLMEREGKFMEDSRRSSSSWKPDVGFSDEREIKVEGKPSMIDLTKENVMEIPIESVENRGKSRKLEVLHAMGDAKVVRPFEELKSVQLVLSDVHVISIMREEGTKKEKKVETNTFENFSEEKIEKDLGHSTFLKIFYLIFYTFVFFCMTALNFIY